MNDITLSILICSIESRKDKLNSLLENLYTQNIGKKAEIIVESDNGNTVIGEKRNTLLKKATGKYISFVDDDDVVSCDYIPSILKAVESNPDCVGIHGIMRGDHGEIDFYHSIEFQGWYTGPGGFYRTPNHLNPVKREIALKIMFKEIQFGEDNHYSNALRFLLKTEKYIEHPIYFYNKSLEIIDK